MDVKFVIESRISGLYEYITTTRIDPRRGVEMKQELENIILWTIQRLNGIYIEKPVILKFFWYEKNRSREYNDILFVGHKLIQDALVKAGIIKDGGWDGVLGFSDSFFIDENRPRVEVVIEEKDSRLSLKDNRWDEVLKFDKFFIKKCEKN